MKIGRQQYLIPPHVDVESLDDLPPAPPGSRYLDFIGGELGWRCFTVPSSMPRCDFFTEYAHLLDKDLLPAIIDTGLVTVRQDSSFPIPGFYIIGFKMQYRSLDRIPEDAWASSAKVMRELRKAMRHLLGIEHIHMYYEEKPHPTCTTHFWLLPVDRAIRNDPDGSVVERLNVHDYLREFRLVDERAAITNNNRLLSRHFETHPVGKQL